MSNLWRGLGLLVTAYYCTLSTGLAFPEGYGSLHPVGGRVLLQLVRQPVSSEEATGAPLMEAAKGGLVERVRDLLMSKEVNPNERDSSGCTALWHATLNGDFAMVMALLEGGADPNIASVNETSPLFLAAQSGDLAIARKLMDFGANVDHPSKKGATALLVAAQAGHKGIVNFFINQGADVSVKKTLSHQSGLWSAAFNGFDEIVQLLVSNGADIEAPELGGATPLYAASQEGQLMVGLTLIESGANVNAPSHAGVIPLHVAAGACHLEMIAILLLFGGNVDSEDFIGRKPTDVTCLERYQPLRQARVEDLLNFADDLDEAISLDDVLRLGVVFDPEVFTRIWGMLGLETEGPVSELNDVEVPLVTASAETRPLVQGATIAGSPFNEGAVKASSSSKTFLYVMIPLLVILGLVGLISGYALGPGHNKKHRSHQRRLRGGQMLIHNPLARHRSLVLDPSSFQARSLPQWLTPQIPRPTRSRGGSLDRAPSHLPQSFKFTDNMLLEQLQEPQWFPPSRCEREGGQPEVAKSEGSNSSGGWGVTIVHLTEEELALRNPVSREDRAGPSNAHPAPPKRDVLFMPRVSPVLEHSPSPEPLPAQRPRNLWKVGMGRISLFGTRTSSTTTDLSGEMSETTEEPTQGGDHPQTSTSNIETFNTSYLGSQGGSSVHYSPRNSHDDA